MAANTSYNIDFSGCEIQPFQSAIFNKSLLLENHFLCPTNGDKLKSTQFCEHTYKCPLDFSEKVRHCEAVCKNDGTWDYQYPSCDDMLPIVSEFTFLDYRFSSAVAQVRKWWIISVIRFELAVYLCMYF